MINFIQTSFSSNIDSFYINKLFREISESLNLPFGQVYHTGIRRNENQIWRRSSDGAEVQLEDWIPHGATLRACFCIGTFMMTLTRIRFITLLVVKLTLYVNIERS